MKYIKTFENIRTFRSELKKSDFIKNKLYLYQYKEYEEDDDYNFIVGTIVGTINYHLIDGYHVNDKKEGLEDSKIIRGNWFPSIYDANEEEIEKYEMFKNAKKYNL